MLKWNICFKKIFQNTMICFIGCSWSWLGCCTRFCIIYSVNTPYIYCSVWGFSCTCYLAAWSNLPLSSPPYPPPPPTHTHTTHRHVASSKMFALTKSIKFNTFHRPVSYLTWSQTGGGGMCEWTQLPSADAPRLQKGAVKPPSRGVAAATADENFKLPAF